MVNGIAPLPYVYIDVALLQQTNQAQKFRSTFIALHEHLDTFLDKKENTLVVSFYYLFYLLNIKLL